MLHGDHTKLHWTGKKHSEKTKKLQSVAKSGKNHYSYGKSRPEYVKKKIANGNRGKIVSSSTKRRISNSLIGDKNPRYGKKNSEKSKFIISEKKKEWWRKKKLQQTNVVVL
jgi:hypothetical protein